MYCTECGKEIPPESNFCPSCGRYLDPAQYSNNTTTSTYSYEPVTKPKSHSNKKSIAILVVVILIAVAVFSGWGSEDEGSLKGRTIYGTFNEEAIIDDSRLYAVFKESGFDNGDAELFFTSFDTGGIHYDTAIRLRLSDSVSSQYSMFKYTLGSTVLEKNEPFVTFYDSLFGSYELSVECRNSDTDPPVTYTFRFSTYFHYPYYWNYDGGHFGFETFIAKADIMPYIPSDKSEKEARSVEDYTLSPEYIVCNENITGIAGELESLYIKAYGEPATGKPFADFILAYVQCCFAYTSDSALYDQDEYFAYPMETLYYCAGDCEDTSILCAALFKAAGFKSAILLLPGHAMAGVALEDYPDSDSGNSYEILCQKVSGTTYYACETTTDSPQESGLSNKSAGYSRYLDKGYAGYGSFTFYPAND